MAFNPHHQPYLSISAQNHVFQQPKNSQSIRDIKFQKSKAKHHENIDKQRKLE